MFWEEWSSITVGPASDGYRLQLSGRNLNSTILCAMKFGTYDLQNMKFTTFDNDQDNNYATNCAQNNENENAGWWYNNCGLVSKHL